MTHLFFMALACKIIAHARLASTVDDTVMKGQSSRLLASTQGRTLTHYVESFLILRDEHNNEVTESVILSPSIYHVYIVKIIYALHRKYKIPYIISLYDVDDLEPFQGIFLIIALCDHIEENVLFVNPRLKVYSPITGKLSTKYTAFTPPVAPRDSFITHVDSDVKKRKSLTDLFYKYNGYAQINAIFSQLFSIEEGLISSYHSNDVVSNPESSFICFIQGGDLGATKRKVILRRPRNISPAYIVQVQQQANDQLALAQKDQKVLEAVFACPNNPNLYSQLVEYVRFLCNVLELLRTLPPVVRSTKEAPHSPDKLYRADLRKVEASLRSQARQQLEKMLPKIDKLTNYYIRNKNKGDLPAKDAEYITLAISLNDVLEETRRYFDEFKATMPHRMLDLPYSVSDVLVAERIRSPFLLNKIIEIFLGEELERALLVQEISRAL